jgi:CheY-like chemotaxis protein
MSELLKSTELNSKQTRYVNTIEQSGQSLLAIISDLQDYSKIEAGTMELEQSSFNLESLIDDCVNTFALRANEKNLDFIVDLDQSITPVLKGDRTKLQQIILNLLSNAFKFTDHGDIILRVEDTHKAAINCIELKFSIKDSGIGLTEQEQKRLFTPFQHADESTYGRYGGSGLGLAISKQLAELMDGKIGVESQSGKGSCFWFTARMMIENNPAPHLLIEKSSQLKGKRLLVLVSSPVYSDIIFRLLSHWGLHVDCAANAEEAKHAIEQTATASAQYDLVLAGVHLQDGTSIELLQQLKLSVAGILVASGNESLNQNELNKAHITTIVDKPVTMASLHDALVSALNPANSDNTNTDEQSIDALLQGLNILVVDDNEVNQMVIKGLLQKQGITAVTAHNGLEAIELLEQSSFDLILMDCEMPTMDGYEATKQIRKKEKLGGQKASIIIALSAHARSDHQQRVIDVGMDGYLTKPVSQAELSKKIRELIPRTN